MRMTLQLPVRSRPARLPTQQEHASGFGEWITLRSSNVHACRYSEGELLLDVSFGDGTTYRYTGVTKVVYQNLLSATSAGQYMHRHVKPIYPATKVG